MPTLKDLENELRMHSDPIRAELSQRFFKTGKGQYGEGDIFLGITTPMKRKIAKKFQDLSLTDTKKVLRSKFHGFRIVALCILMHKFKKGSSEDKKRIYNIYLDNTKYINSWDLVDISAPNIVGTYLLDKDRKVLYKLAKSKNLWKKRIAILSTYPFIRNNDFKDTLSISEILLNDDHDLIHKAVGWMLREVGNRDREVEEKFLDKYALKMQRTILRYAIEKFPEVKRLYYLKLK